MMRLAVVMIVMAITMPAIAQDAPPQVSVRPEPRPEIAPSAAVPQPAAPQAVRDKTARAAIKAKTPAAK